MYVLVRYDTRNELFVNKIDEVYNKVTQIECYNGSPGGNGATFSLSACRKSAKVWIEAETLEEIEVHAALEAL